MAGASIGIVASFQLWNPAPGRAFIRHSYRKRTSHAYAVVFTDDHAERDVRRDVTGGGGTGRAGPRSHWRVVIMMSWAITFLVIALIAAVLYRDFTRRNDDATVVVAKVP